MCKIAYRCPRIDKELKIDGLLDEQDWYLAKALEFFVPVTLQQPVSKTVAKLLYNQKYLYVGFTCFDKDIRATYVRRDSPIWEEDVVEVFIMTSCSGGPYFEFEFSPIKTIFDAFFVYPERTNKSIIESSKWNCEGILVESFVSGTINDPSDFDNHWTIEIAIPFLSLPTLKNPPKKGEKWLFHLARYDYSYVLKNYRELSSCAYLTDRNFHKFDQWLTLVFD
ncbi:MAG: carbohydrate-binding family 9-like protein [Candidatus Omnitrophica bacterium]|nr:carbohydrate-binding family 9-like protein [Candidatus Omnitrophota bacterium]